MTRTLIYRHGLGRHQCEYLWAPEHGRGAPTLSPAPGSFLHDILLTLQQQDTTAFRDSTSRSPNRRVHRSFVSSYMQELRTLASSGCFPLGNARYCRPCDAHFLKVLQKSLLRTDIIKLREIADNRPVSRVIRHCYLITLTSHESYGLPLFARRWYR